MHGLIVQQVGRFDRDDSQLGPPTLDLSAFKAL
jgi:hypothetical protein